MRLFCGILERRLNPNVTPAVRKGEFPHYHYRVGRGFRAIPTGRPAGRPRGRLGNTYPVANSGPSKKRGLPGNLDGHARA